MSETAGCVVTDVSTALWNITCIDTLNFNECNDWRSLVMVGASAVMASLRWSKCGESMGVV